MSSMMDRYRKERNRSKAEIATGGSPENHRGRSWQRMRVVRNDTGTRAPFPGVAIATPVERIAEPFPDLLYYYVQKLTKEAKEGRGTMAVPITEAT